MRSIFFVFFLAFVAKAYSQSIAINTDGSMADSSAILDVKSSTKGILIPRLSTTERLAVINPAKGLLVFDTTTISVWFFSGSAWMELKGVGSPNFWQSHTNGIYYSSGKIGIGMTPSSQIPLTVYQANSGVGGAIAHFRSNDVWHSALSLFNGNIGSEKEYSFILAGPNNTNALPGTLGLFNHQTSTWGFNFHPTTNYMAVGSTSAFNSRTAKSRLHVFGGDVNVDQIGSGIILKSPNGNCWRVTIDDAGNLVRTAISCP